MNSNKKAVKYIFVKFSRHRNFPSFFEKDTGQDIQTTISGDSLISIEPPVKNSMVIIGFPYVLSTKDKVHVTGLSMVKKNKLLFYGNHGPHILGIWFNRDKTKLLLIMIEGYNPKNKKENISKLLEAVMSYSSMS
jgi:hypothetical protein